MSDNGETPELMESRTVRPFAETPPFYILSNGIGVTVQAIEALSDTEIGAQVRVLVPEVFKAHAHDTAVWFLNNAGKRHEKPWQLPEFAIEQVRERCSDWRGVSTAIDAALAAVDRYDDWQRNRNAAPQRRQQVRSAYDRLFMTVGRRDGFACQACGAVHDLQIDHIQPVVRGGESDVSNLQLLCGGCNRTKGTQVRTTEGAAS